MIMIRVVHQGTYRLLETARKTKVLTLEINDKRQSYAWINAPNIGEILILAVHTERENDTSLAIGKYRLYEVKDEPQLTDLVHLELHAGDGTWQGYLLPTGMPHKKDKRNRIISTREVITKPTN